MELFTETSTGIGGGLENAIVGTLLITFGVAILSGLVGVGCGIYLAEFSPRSRTSAILRGAGEILSGIPSIVFGYCGYLTLVIGLHWGFSLLPALIVLSLLVVPYIAKSTELASNQVPLAYREGAEALGMKRTYLLRKVVVRPALPGILTGLIIGTRHFGRRRPRHSSTRRTSTTISRRAHLFIPRSDTSPTPRSPSTTSPSQQRRPLRPTPHSSW